MTHGVFEQSRVHRIARRLAVSTRLMFLHDAGLTV
jgi:hypothetical protein